MRSHEETISAYIDTGFDGYLIIPASYTRQLKKGDYLSRWELGDGSLAVAEEYLGVAGVVGLAGEFPVRITCLGDQFLVGRGIIDRFRLVLDHGKQIQIE